MAQTEVFGMNRKSMIATGIALTLLLGGAVGAYCYVDHKKNSEAAAEKAEQDSLNLYSFDTSTLKGIDFTTSEGYFKISLNEEGKWVMDDTDYPYDFTLNNYYLNVVSTAVSRLKADHKVKADGNDLSKYGLDSPVTLVCHTDEKDCTLYVGGSSVTNEFSYVMLPDDDTIYCIDNETGKSLLGEVSSLRNPYLLECDDNEIMQFSLVHNGETQYDLTRNNGGTQLWSMNAPETDITVDAVTVNTILTSLVRVQADQFDGFTKEKLELAKYGLDDPAYTFTVKTAEKTMTLEFPEFDKEAEEVWCYDENSGAVFTISGGSTAFLSGKWYDLSIKQVMSVPFMSVASLDISVDGETHTLSVDHDKNTYIFDDIDVTAKNSEDAAKDFEYLYASVSEISHADFRDDIPEKMGEPTCTFTYTLTDGGKRELALVPIDDETYWAYTDGKCIGMTVARSAVNGTNGCNAFIEKLSEDLGI